MSETTSIQLSNVYEGGRTYLFENLSLEMRITEFKVLVCDQLEEHPLPVNQRLIHRGKICDDASTLRKILNHTSSPPHIFHLVLSGRTSIKRAMSEPVKAPSASKVKSINTPKPPMLPSSRVPSTPSIETQTTPSSVSRADARNAAAEAAEARKRLFSPSADTSISNEHSNPQSATNDIQIKVEDNKQTPIGSNGIEGGGGGGGGGVGGEVGGGGETLKSFEESYVQAASSSPAALAAHEVWCGQVHQWRQEEAVATRAAQILYQRMIAESWAARSYTDRGFATTVEEAYAAHAGMSSHWMQHSHTQPSISLRNAVPPPQVREINAVRTMEQLMNAYRARNQQPPQPEHEENAGNGQGADPLPNLGQAAPNAPNGVVRRFHFVFFFGPDDLKLALKLIVMVGLFGQYGDNFRFITLACCALVVFIYQVYSNNLARRRQLAAEVARNGNADNAGAGEEAASANQDNNRDDDEALPPLEMRGLLQGGIAPGGGFIVDIGYFLVSFVASLVPSWQPVPVCDPVILERRRVIEARRAMRAQQSDQQQEDDFEDLPPLPNNHLHQD